MASAGIRSIIISIHALLAESDLYPMRAFEPIGIAIHALLAESDGAVSAVDSGI